MEIPVFNGENDAYWWVLSGEVNKRKELEVVRKPPPEPPDAGRPATTLQREFPPSSPNQPTWYPSISPTSSEPFDPGNAARLIGHVRVTGAATTTKFGSGLSSQSLVGVRAIEYVNEDRPGKRRGVKGELQHISKYFDGKLKQYYGLVGLIHDNSYIPIRLLDPNPQVECFSLLQCFVRALFLLQAPPASAVVSPNVKAERRCLPWLPSLICTWFPWKISPIMPLKQSKPMESWGGAYPFIKSSTSLLSACPDSLVLQDGKEMHVCAVKTCDDGDTFLAIVLVDRECQEMDITFVCASLSIFLCGIGSLEGWNLIACNVACSVVYQWMEREKVSPKSIIWNSWIDEFAQQGLQREFIYALKWLLVMKGNYGFQVCKHYDSYALLELKGFNYKNLTAEDETVVIRIDGVSDDSHAPQECLPLFGILCKSRDVQVEGKWMRKYYIVVITLMHKYDVCDDMLIIIQGLGDNGAPDHILKLVKKHLSFDMNRNSLGKNITPTMLVMDDMLAPLNLEGMKAEFVLELYPYMHSYNGI
ncbi:hypothetical protein P8452_12306 [Trifolium repens]|nr:hypothetical protein P8452_12274 [Trifolium repens]WJX23059.1 hypothetical protein P8452_12306 [Trifolium repens]